MLNEIKTFLGQDWKDAEDLVRSSLASDIELLDKTNEAILSSTGKQTAPGSSSRVPVPSTIWVFTGSRRRFPYWDLPRKLPV